MGSQGKATVPAPAFDFSLIGPALPSGVALTRASIGTYIDINGHLATVPANQPRFEYTGATGITILPPVVQNDAYTTPQSTALTISAPGVLTNDTDPQGQAIIVNSFDTISAHGSIACNNDGSFTYTPVSGYSGSDSWTYNIKNTSSLISVSRGTVAMTITPVSNPIASIAWNLPAAGATVSGPVTFRFTGQNMVLVQVFGPNGILTATNGSTSATITSGNTVATFIYNSAQDVDGTESYSATAANALTNPTSTASSGTRSFVLSNNVVTQPGVASTGNTYDQAAAITAPAKAPKPVFLPPAGKGGPWTPVLNLTFGNAPHGPLQYNGFGSVDYFNTAPATTDASMQVLATTGANAVEVGYILSQANSTANSVNPPAQSDANFTHAIDTIIGLGMTCFVKMYIIPSDGSNWGLIAPANPSAWFASYQAQVVHAATLAQAHGATIFGIGDELYTLTGAVEPPSNANPAYPPLWATLITAVRNVFTGKLTYSGINGEAGYPALASFWPQLDYIGVDAYFNLGTGTPTLAQMQAAWSQPTFDTYPHNFAGGPIAWMQSLAAQFGKQIMINEIGFWSAPGGAANFGNGNTPYGNVQKTDANYNPQLQVDALTASFNALTASNSNNYLAGIFIWYWGPDLNYGVPYGFAGYDIYSKPSQTYLTSLYTAPSTGGTLASPTITALATLGNYVVACNNCGGPPTFNHYNNYGSVATVPSSWNQLNKSIFVPGGNQTMAQNGFVTGEQYSIGSNYLRVTAKATITGNVGPGQVQSGRFSPQLITNPRISGLDFIAETAFRMVGQVGQAFPFYWYAWWFTGQGYDSEWDTVETFGFNNASPKGNTNQNSPCELAHSDSVGIANGSNVVQNLTFTTNTGSWTLNFDFRQWVTMQQIMYANGNWATYWSGTLSDGSTVINKLVANGTYTSTNPIGLICDNSWFGPSGNSRPAAGTETSARFPFFYDYQYIRYWFR